MLKTECFCFGWSKILEEYDLEVQLEDVTPQVSQLNFCDQYYKRMEKLIKMSHRIQVG